MIQKDRRLFYFLFLASFTGVLSEESFGLRLTTEGQKTKENTQYRFRYVVKDETTGDYKVQEETKEGDSVHGSYTIAEPNGDLRTVTYKAGPGKGFEAKVNVQPNASPIKPLPEVTTAAYTIPIFDDSNEKEKPVTVKPATNLPRANATDIITKPDQKTEMGMNCSLKSNTVTETVAEESTVATNLENVRGTGETTTEATGKLTSDDVQKEESVSIEARDINDDPIEKELDEALNFMPKLPELVLPTNKSHFKFYKDPEEALLDERITQIARQLAETSLRREYEERKLGHILPISVTPITTSRYSSKSNKFRPSESPVQVLNHVNLVPQYIYRNTQLPTFVPFDRFPIIRSASNVGNGMRQSFETTNIPDFQKFQKHNNPTTEFNQAFREPISVVPIHVPTFLQFFSPYVAPTMRTVSQNRITERQISVNPPFKDVTESSSETTYGQVTNKH